MPKKINIEKKILKKSVSLFYKYGYTRASIRDIVKAVGINNSTVYLYYKNKAEILFNIIVDIGAELLEELGEVIERKHDQNDTIECLQAMIFKQICFSTERHKEMKIYLEEQFQLPSHLRKKAYKQHRQIYDLYYSKVCQLEKKGLLNNRIDKAVITFGIFAMINWVYRWFQPNGPLSIENIAENIIEMFFAGILREGSEHQVNSGILSN